MLTWGSPEALNSEPSTLNLDARQPKIPPSSKRWWVGTLFRGCREERKSCTYWVYIEVMLGLYWVYIGAILGLYWGYIGFILGLYWICIGFISGLHWVYVGVIFGLDWGYIGASKS